MAPAKRAAAKSRLSSASKTMLDGSPPKPYRRIPDSLEPFVAALDPKHVYITHVDTKPAAFKRKIFLVPVALNLAVVALFLLRLRWVGPWYLQLLVPGLDLESIGLGHLATTDPTVGMSSADMTWAQIALLALRRGLTFTLDLALVVFVWPWPVEFCLGRFHGNPARWRWAVGFRDKEVYVRRSREWDRKLAADLFNSSEPSARLELSSRVRLATSPTLISEKTGYLTMNADWDLDWAAMVRATRLVDSKSVALDAFRLLVLVHHDAYGWMVLDTGAAPSSQEDERRRQVFAFRDALAAVGKEDLFFRWIEIVQFEVTGPGGFTKEKEVAVAQQIRDLFKSNGIDFDEFWRESVGSDGIAGMG